MNDKKGNQLSDVSCAAQEFNDFFLDSIDSLIQLLGSANPPLVENSIRSSIFLSPIDISETKEIIRKVAVKNSAGYDGIPCSILIHIIDFIAPVLTELINSSFCQGIFPDNLKTAIVIPIHKKNDSMDIANYRAVCLLSVFSKVYENAFYNRLIKFINNNNIFYKYQFGFRKGLSTQDAMVSFINYILEQLDKNQKVVGIFFDFTRAFDMVDHSILLKKIYNYGIRGPAYNWLCSYLSNRTQKVILKSGAKEYHSDLRSLRVGVPQGSTLGPLLFLLFINDINKTLNFGHVSLFADDTAAVASDNDFKSLSQKASMCTKNMENYCNNNGLLLNTSKSQLISFTTRENNCSLLVKTSSKSLIQSPAVKFLGIEIDCNLSWFPQIEIVLKKLSMSCFALWQMRKLVNKQTLLAYYYAYVNSILSYGIITWGNSTRITDVLIMQKRIIRTICFKPITHSCRDLFKQLNILTVISVYIFNCVMYVKSNIENFTQTLEATQYNLRHGSHIRLPPHKLSLLSNSSYVMPARLFNNLPMRIKNIENINRFKKSLKSLLLEHSFYTVHEYFSTPLL